MKASFGLVGRGIGSEGARVGANEYTKPLDQRSAGRGDVRA